MVYKCYALIVSHSDLYSQFEDANAPVYGSYGNTNEGLNFTIQPYDSNALHESSRRKLEEKLDKPYVIDTEEFSISK